MLRYIYAPEKGVFNYINNMDINIFKNNAILGKEVPIIGVVLASIMIGICLLGIVVPQTTNADFVNTTTDRQKTTVASYVAKASNEDKKITKTINVVITAYSSTPEETDDTPFITASGKYVEDGIVANNMLPFGTKIKIPSIYGDKIFVVEDRMNRRMGDHRFDIWFPTKSQALIFGAKTTEIEILES